MRHVQRSNSDYDSKAFQERQKKTITRRKEILKLLGLPEAKAYHKEIELRDDRRKEFPTLPAFINRRGLEIVHYKDNVVDKEMLHKARGVVVYNNKYIIRKSIPYSETETLNKLNISKDIITLNISKVGVADSSTIKALVTDIKIHEYVEGSVMDVVCVNGVLQVWTSHNLMPEGAILDGKTVAKPARIESFHEAMYESFERIVMGWDSRILDKDYMFGPGVQFSPFIYRFILVTRERVKAYTGYIPEGGYLIYLGPQKQWTYDMKEPVGMPKDLYGEKSVENPVIRTVPSPPGESEEPFVLSRSSDLDVNTANAILRGKPVSDYRFTEGGKLIITGIDSNGASFQAHVQSSSYKHREMILGPGTNPYNDFVVGLSIKQYDLTSREGISNFHYIYADFDVPHMSNVVYPLCRERKDLPLTIPQSDWDVTIPKSLLHCIAYNYIVCTNRWNRHEACMYLKRYIADRTGLVQWLAQRRPDDKYTGYGKDVEGKRIADFVNTTKAEMDRSESYKVGGYEQALLTIDGVKASKLISVYRSNTGTTKDSVRISSPDYEFQPPKLPTIEI